MVPPRAEEILASLKDLPPHKARAMLQAALAALGEAQPQTPAAPAPAEAPEAPTPAPVPEPEPIGASPALPAPAPAALEPELELRRNLKRQRRRVAGGIGLGLAVLVVAGVALLWPAQDEPAPEGRAQQIRVPPKKRTRPHAPPPTAEDLALPDLPVSPRQAQAPAPAPQKPKRVDGWNEYPAPQQKTVAAAPAREEPFEDEDLKQLRNQ